MADTPAPAPRSPEAPSSQSTRQLLDELDALMQRMLALPVQQVDEVRDTPLQAAPPREVKSMPATAPRAVELVPPPATVWPGPSASSPPPEIISSRAPTIFAPPEPAEPSVPLPAKPATPELLAPAYLPLGAEPLLPIIVQRPKGAAAEIPPLPRVQPPAVARSADRAATPDRRDAGPTARPAWMRPSGGTGAPPVPPAGLVAQTLLGINRTYDRSTTWLGPVGRWLRGEQARSVLGWTGVAMLAAALVWAAVRFLG